MTHADFNPRGATASKTPPSPEPAGLRLRSANAAACSKTILVGEHAVVYGARAVALPVLNMRMTVKVTPTENKTKAGEPLFRVYLGGRSVSDHLTGVIGDAFAALAMPPRAVDVEGHSTVPIGAGLGSSASLCIVVLKALAAARGTALTREQLAAAGNKLERRFHGNPSGLDTAVVAWEEAILFAKGALPRAVAGRPLATERGASPWRFALLDTGARSSTLAMIQIAQPSFQGQAGEQRLARFDAIAAQTVAGLGGGEALVVADAMKAAARELGEVGVVSPAIEDVMTAAYEAGALAAKPTGAGGGGCVLALLDAARAEQQLAELRQKLGGGRVYGVEWT